MADYTEDLDPRTRALIALKLLDPETQSSMPPVVGRDGKVIPAKGAPFDPYVPMGQLPPPPPPAPAPRDPNWNPAPLSGPLKVGTGPMIGETRAESVAGAMPPAPVEGFDPGLADSDPRALATHPGLRPQVPAESPYALGEWAPEAQGERFAVLPDARETLPPGPQRKMTPLQAAEMGEEQAILDAGQAQSDLARAQVAAQRQTVNAQAAAVKQHSQAKARADINYQWSREMARQNAAIETQKWVQSMEDMAKREPNHQRYWQNQDGFGKALWLLGMAFSGAAQIGRVDAGMRPNPVLEMLQTEISQDIESQKERMARERDVMKTKGDIMFRTQEQSIADLKDDHSMAWARLDALERAAVLKASAPGTEADHAALLQGQAWIQQAKVNLMERKANYLRQAQEAAIARAHASGEKALDRKLQLDLARIEAAAKIASTPVAKPGPAMRGPFKEEDLDDVSSGTGMKVYNEDTKQVQSLLIKGRDSADFRKTSQFVNSKYHDMKVVHDALQKGDDWEVILRSNPELESAFNSLAYKTARENDPRGIVTDKDFANGSKTLLGSDWDSFSGRIKAGMSITATPKEVADFLAKEIKNYPARTEERLTHFLDARVYQDETGRTPRVKLKFSPVDLSNKEAYEPTVEDRAKQLGAPSAPHQKIGSPHSLDEAERLEKVAPGSLPPYTSADSEAAVREFKADAAKLSPSRIDDFADTTIKRVRGDDRARAEIAREQTRLRTEATDKLNQVIHEGVWKDRAALIGYVKTKLGIQLNAYEGDAWVAASKAYWSTKGK